jgi:hypothetical protein
MKVAVCFREDDVGSIELDGGKLIPPYLPPTPGIYLLRSTDGDGAYGYVGETAQLRRRWAQVRSPGPTQRTNLHLRGRPERS